jgi:hypothetical protein
LGHFYAAIGNDVKKVYVLPAGVPETVGVDVALGERSPESVRDEFLKVKVMEVDEDLWKEKYEQLEKQFESKIEEERQKAYREALQKVDEIKKQWNVEEYQQTIVKLKDDKITLETELKKLEPLKAFREALAKFLKELMPTPIPASSLPQGNGPSEMLVVTEQPAITIQKRASSLTLDDSTLEGKIAIVYAEGKLPADKWFTTTDMVNAFASHAWPRDPRIGPTLDKLCQWGFFEKHYSGRRPEYRVKLSPEDARSKGLIKEAEA